MIEWWLSYGWRGQIIEDYAVSLWVALVWLVAAGLRRRQAGEAGRRSSIWAVPVLAWALQSVAAGLKTTQLDLVAGVSRVPYMCIYAASAAVAGAVVVVACFAADRIRGVSVGDYSPRNGALLLCLVAWTGVAVTWGVVLVREAVFVQTQ